MQTVVTIPPNSRILVSIDQYVEAHDHLAEEQSGTENVVPLAKLIHIAPSAIHTLLKKKLGDSIKIKEIIAEKKGFFKDVVYLSDYEGTLTDINTQKGTISISSGSSHVIVAPKSGIVSDIAPTSITIQSKSVGSKKNNTIPLQHIEQDFTGKLLIFNHMNNIDTDDVEDAIIVAETLSITERLKLEALGARAFITVRLTYTKLPHAIVSQQPLRELQKHSGAECFCSSASSSAVVY
jgi:hypothetical protein